MSGNPSSPEQKGNIVLGFVVLALVGAAVFFAVRAVYRLVYPPPPTATIALSAYFDEADGRARFVIEGHVQRGGASVENGRVGVSVNRLVGDFRQSFMVPVGEDGYFRVDDSPALRSIRPADKLYVEADAWSDGVYLGSDVVYHQASKPLIPRERLLWAGTILFLMLLAGFLWTFTGSETQLKNRLAIACSYLVILLFLSGPLMLPVFLKQSYPDVESLMRETPVGLVNGIANGDDEESKNQPQWHLNIGGATRLNATAVPESVIISGGLVIPFYILVLSCLGGAINMTRKVPNYHDDALGADPFERALFTGWTKIKNLVGTKSAPESDSVPEKQRRRRGHPNHEESWRVGLIKQYMYLISAPFLAIVTYYLLIWLDLTQKPIVVLVSFSVGLISDQIVELILKLVRSLLSRGRSSSSRQPPPETALAPGK